jgi:hypothetical protein
VKWAIFCAIFSICPLLRATPYLQPVSDLKTPSTAEAALGKELAGVGQDWWLKNRGLLAEESPRVAGYFYAFRSIKGFADRGDRIWEVRMIYLFTQCPTGVLWINEKTKAVMGLGVPR